MATSTATSTSTLTLTLTLTLNWTNPDLDHLDLGGEFADRRGSRHRLADNADALGEFGGERMAQRLMKVASKYVASDAFSELQASQISKSVWGNTKSGPRKAVLGHLTHCFCVGSTALND